MRRHLDLTALRSFAAVADTGGVTRAAGLLNLTQSAVSMQLKRLETMLDVPLLDRTQRQIRVTVEGEQLLRYARRILALNDEVVTRMTDPGHEGEVVLGVPHDIVYPVIPGILRTFQAAFPKMRINLLSSATTDLKARFSRGEVQAILTTEPQAGPGGEVLCTLPLQWVGAPGGRAWSRRPLRLAFQERCIFRIGAQAALDRAGIDWDMAVMSDNTQSVEASVTADLAVHVAMAGTCPSHMEPIEHGGALPPLEPQGIILYHVPPDAAGLNQAPLAALCDMVRTGYAALAVQDYDLPSRAAVA